MTILLPKGLPANFVLRGEGLTVLDHGTPTGHFARPLRIALVNLMPLKAATETQIARMLALGPAPVDLVLTLPDGYHPGTERADHVRRFYRHWVQLDDKGLDAIVITGAPVETLPFDSVTYWHALVAIFDWAASHAVPVLAICWAAQAALAHFHGVAKHRLGEKRFGVFDNTVVQPASPYLKGLAGGFACPVSRHTEVRPADLPPGVRILAQSNEAGLCLVEDPARRGLYMFNHLEYDRETLSREYQRDLATGRNDVKLPRNYFPGDDPSRRPHHQWRSAGRQLFGNWMETLQLRQNIEQTPPCTLAYHSHASLAAG